MDRPAMLSNIITNTDHYKHSHVGMYPAGTEYVSSYIESRGGKFPASLFVGLQAFIREYLMEPLTVADVNDAERVLRAQGVYFNRQNWLDIVNEHGGYLPIEIEAVPEGAVVPTRNVLVQLVNTDPKFPWVTSFIETALLRAVWYPTTVATVSWMSKQFLRGMFERTSDNPELLRIYVHDYGARGVSSQESATLGGLAHLLNFDQTDTASAFLGAEHWYGAAAPNGSQVHQEHSVVCSFGPEGEAESYRRVLHDFPGAVIVGLLTDSFDHENAVRNILPKELKDDISNFPGLVLVRCDSGDPVEVPVQTVEWLMEGFGYETNSKGFKVLPPYVRVAQGDGLTVESHKALYLEMERRGLAVDNVVCGMGGGLLQRCNRDTLNFGQKANAVCINGQWKDVAKRPTGSSMKRSKAGRLALQYVDGDYRTVPRDSIPPEENVLVPVYSNGKLLTMWDFAGMIERSERPTPAYYYDGPGEASGS